MIKNSLVSVTILSYNRKNELRHTLTKVYEQDYKNIEVIVVDNASSDGSGVMVKNEFPEVQLITLDRNYGIEAFNWVIRRVKGDYILILDDDSYPEYGSIAKAIDYIENDESCGVVAFNIYNMKFDFFETKDLRRGYVHYFIGCGIIMKSKLINEVGFYDELFFVYVNDLDLSIRIINHGYKIFYLEESLVVHSFTGGTQDSVNSTPNKSKFRFYHVTRGYLIFLCKHFSFKWVLVYLIKWNLNRMIVSFRFNYWLVYFRSILSFIRILPSVIKKRQVMRKEVQELYKYGKIPLIDRDFFPTFNKSEFYKIKLFR